MKSKTNVDFRKTTSLATAARLIARHIDAPLAEGKKVLWLLSGGSAIKLAVEVAKIIKDNPYLANLNVTLADERFGPVGHSDSNWQQLLDGSFSLPQAKLEPVLKGKSLNKTLTDYTDLLKNYSAQADYSLALAGIGSDGHTFGIKPGSPAIDSEKLVVAFRWNDYTRLTPTTKFLQLLDEVVVYAIGKEKQPQLEALEQDLPIAKQPAQALKQVKKLIVINDIKGEKL